MASYSKVIIAILIIVSLSGIADALTQTYEYQGTQNIACNIVAAGQECGQKVTLSNAHRDNVFRIAVYMWRAGTPNDLTIKLYQSSASGGAGALLNTWTLPYSSVPNTAGWVTVVSTGFTFPDPDNPYYLFSLSGGVDGNNYYQIRVNNAGGYSGGTFWFKDGGVWTEYPSYDMAFEFDWEYNQVVSSAPTQISPANGATGVSLTPTFQYGSVTDPDGDLPVRYWVVDTITGSSYAGCNGVTGTSCTVSSNLSGSTTYNWYTAAWDNWCYVRGGCGKVVSGAWSFTTGDFTPPNTITGLSVSGYSDSYISWNWTNPTDPDFNHVEIYRNGGWVANVSAPSHSVNFLNLYPSTSYTISTRTVDNTGNINPIWVNLTQRTSPACATNEICQLIVGKSNSQIVGQIGNTFKITGVIAPVYIKYIQVAVSRSPSYTADMNLHISTTTFGGLPDIDLTNEVTNYTTVPIYPSYEFIPLFTGTREISPDVTYAFYVDDVMTEGALYVLSSGTNNYINGNYVYWPGAGNWYSNSSDDVAFIIGYTASSLSMQNETYVKWNGRNSNVGTSWAYAFDTIDFAVDHTNSYNTSIIHIAPGNYSLDPQLNKRTKARFKCEPSGPAQNASEVWCRYPRWNMTQ